jgi:hypothetical protein
MPEETVQPGTTAEQPFYFKWVRDEDGGIRWGRLILALALTAASAYLSVQAQRAGSSPDLNRTLVMSMARKRITLGVKIQRTGKAVEDAGWASYERLRP